MTKKQFRHDMLRGLGSCQLALEQSDDIEDYREDVLWGIKNAMAYDAQCEGTRAAYLFEMIEHFDDWSEFYDAAASGAKRNLKDPGWRFLHFAEILALMAGAGYAPAQETVMKIYELLLYVIRTGRPSKTGVWSSLDNFSGLCVAILTYAVQMQEDREAFYLRALADYGKTLFRKPMLDSRCADEWFEAVAEENIGKERIHELLTLKKDDPDISRYLKNRDQLKAEREAYQAQTRKQEAMDSAQSIFSRLLNGDTPGGKILPLLLLRRVEKEQGIEEITKLTLLYAVEEQEQIREATLHLFQNKSSIAAFEDSGISQLLRDAESENEGLRDEALRVLTDLRNDRVREYALFRLKRQPKDTCAVCILITNYQPGDGKHLISLMKSVPHNDRNGEWHGVFSRVRDAIDRDQEADRELSEILLPYMLREGFCSVCRLTLLELMKSRDMLTPELIEESRHDCNLEIRRFVAGL